MGPHTGGPVASAAQQSPHQLLRRWAAPRAIHRTSRVAFNTTSLHRLQTALDTALPPESAPVQPRRNPWSQRVPVETYGASDAIPRVTPGRRRRRSRRSPGRAGPSTVRGVILFHGRSRTESVADRGVDGDAGGALDEGDALVPGDVGV